MRLALVCVLGLLALASAAPTASTMFQFLTWARQFEKSYASSEETQHRFDVFVENLAKIEHYNSLNLSWTAGLNEFSDMSTEEFGRIYTIKSLPRRLRPVRVKDTHKWMPNDDIDWRTKGAVGPVHNQGSTGASSSMVAADSVAGWNVINNASKPAYVDLSWDQITDALGVNNWPATGIQYAAVAGLCTQASWVRDRRNCARVSQPNEVDISESERELWTYVTKVPATVAFQVDTAFQFYTSGIFSGPCAKQWNHALLFVGGTNDYWIAKNSWGTSWGEQGYVRIKRGEDVCGLSFEEAIPI